MCMDFVNAKVDQNVGKSEITATREKLKKKSISGTKPQEVNNYQRSCLWVPFYYKRNLSEYVLSWLIFLV